MRNKLEAWESGVLCELWHRVELNVLDEKPRTPQHLLKQVGRELRDMQWEYKPRVEQGKSCYPPSDQELNDRFEFAKRRLRWKGKSPGR